MLMYVHMTMHNIQSTILCIKMSNGYSQPGSKTPNIFEGYAMVLITSSMLWYAQYDMY